MKNWARCEADVNLLMNKHYTKGRAGKNITKIVVHHNAGSLSVKECWDTWQKRQASAHYQVEADGTIGQLVWDRDTAWHAGDLKANQTSIGIEHANNSTKNWTISEATLDNGAHLVAALCHLHGLGEPRWGVNVFPHQHFSATACPGAIAGAQNAKYMERAQYWYKQMASQTPAKPAQPVKKPVAKKTTPKKSIDAIAHEVIAGKWGTGNARKTALKNAGYNYQTVQNKVNQILNGKATPKKSIDTIAHEVIAGKWGNGNDRATKLAKAGYSYSAVQARVNQILL